MTRAEHIRTSAIIPALTRLGLYSFNAERLLMGTAAVESGFFYIQQLGGGPALGLFQMEPATFDWLLNELLRNDRLRRLRGLVVSMSGVANPGARELIFNNLFAAAMARIRYLAVNEPIPATVDQQATYWWNHYNGRSLHGLKPQDYIARWDKYCAPIYAGLPACGPVEATRLQR